MFDLKRIVVCVFTVAAVTIAVALAATTPGSGTSPAGAAVAAGSPNPIKHVVVILEENHSFDNVLGKFCAEVQSGALKRPGKDSHCDGATTGTTSTGQVIPLASAPDYVPFADHSVVGQQRDIDGGKMDGFNGDPNCANDLSACYSQYDPMAGPCAAKSCIPNYAALATRYTVSDRTFELDASPSWAGHLVWATANQDGFYGTNPITSSTGPQPVAVGSGWGCDSGRVTPWGPDNVLVPSCVPDADGSLGPNWAGYTGPMAPHIPTIFDELSGRGLSWKIYGGDGTPGASSSPYSAQGWQWAICPTFAECLYSAQRDNVTSTTQLLADASAGALPSYAIVTPTAVDSQHNNNDMSTGDNYIGQTVAAIQAGPDWSSTAIFITYDDCGCFYDHVDPLQYNATWGIRVPMVIVSPYVKLGYTDSTPTTFAGTLAFVEHLFGLPPLNSTDATAYDYRGAFCYNPALTGCIPAGLTPLAAVRQKPTPLSAAQKAAQFASGYDDT
jgi:phospholipase C